MEEVEVKRQVDERAEESILCNVQKDKGRTYKISDAVDETFTVNGTFSGFTDMHDKGVKASASGMKRTRVSIDPKHPSVRPYLPDHACILLY